MRNQRQEAILSLIEEREIETQGELCAALAARGFSVTQATVSRDVKDLHLFKVRGTQKRFRQEFSSTRTTSPFRHGVVFH